MIDIYKRALETMPSNDISHWCSDLYLRKTEQSSKLVAEYDFKQNVTTFIDAIDHAPWYEIPFAYTPHYNPKNH